MRRQAAVRSLAGVTYADPLRFAIDAVRRIYLEGATLREIAEYRGEPDVFLRHGVVRERMAALLTDEIRTLILEDLGYTVDVIEFTDLENSPKNLMLRAKRTGRRSHAGRDLARSLCARYGFTQTLLELTEGL